MAVIVSNHYDEDMTWLQRQKQYPYVVYSKTSRAFDHFLPRNVGQEHAAYLQYIVDHYKDLPETMVFIHGHERRPWHQRGRLLDSLERLGDLGRYRCVNINRPSTLWNLLLFHPGAEVAAETRAVIREKRFLTLTYRIYEDPARLREYMEILGVDAPERLPSYVFTKAAAQFVVHRDVVRSHTRGYWRRLLRALYRVGGAMEDPRRVGFHYEYLDFYLLTGQPDEYMYYMKKEHLREGRDGLGVGALVPRRRAGAPGKRA